MASRGPNAAADDRGGEDGGGDDRDAVFVNHDAALAYLAQRPNFERSRARRADAPETFKLGRMHALLAAIGDPHKAVPTVHVAGSKGKGSVCAMLEGALRASGHTTGLFTSPHLVDVRERVRIGGALIGRDAFDAALALCRRGARAIEPKHGEPTYFEMITALAFTAFMRGAVDIAVIETGLGGRLDCTNVITPAVVGLTSIQLEHTEVLGDTLEKIAHEKAGIMKPGVRAISVPQDDAVLGVFREHAKKVGCELSVLGEDISYSDRFQSSTTRAAHRRVCVGDGDAAIEHLSVPLAGAHQAINCGLALALCGELKRLGRELPRPRVVAGIESVRRPGCLEEVRTSPRIFVDGAHTGESVRATLLAAREQLSFDSLVVILGCARDKDIGSILEALRRCADKVVFTRARNDPRAADPSELCEMFERGGIGMCEWHTDPADAVRAAARAVRRNDAILALGSFVLAGEVKAFASARPEHAASR